MHALLKSCPPDGPLNILATIINLYNFVWTLNCIATFGIRSLCTLCIAHKPHIQFSYWSPLKCLFINRRRAGRKVFLRQVIALDITSLKFNGILSIIFLRFNPTTRESSMSVNWGLKPNHGMTTVLNGLHWSKVSPREPLGAIQLLREHFQAKFSLKTYRSHYELH